MKKVLLGNNGIAFRHLALKNLELAFDLTPDALHQRFADHAPALGTEAARGALKEAGIHPADIGAVVVSTCTGTLCPGLSTYLIERLGLPTNVLALDLVGQGCGAAIPNLAVARSLLNSDVCAHVLSVCVEVCSAAFFLDDDPGVLISACLFGDAAGAAVVSTTPGTSRPTRWLLAKSRHDPAQRDLLRFEQRGGMLRNILTRDVPNLAARHAHVLLQDTLAEANVNREDITTWIWHAGGRDVLTALQQQLGLDEAALCWSATVLRELGNVSSPFVYHVLKKALQQGAPAGRWWMGSFGAGFSSHGALLEVAP